MKKYKVIINIGQNHQPYDFELSAAIIIANYFKQNVEFLRPTNLKTPDLKIKDELWELKSPRGNSKNTIHNIFVTSRKQSYNIIIDLRRCKMNERKALSRIRDAYNKRRHQKCKLLIIRKSGKVLDVKDII